MISKMNREEYEVVVEYIDFSGPSFYCRVANCGHLVVQESVKTVGTRKRACIRGATLNQLEICVDHL